MATFDYDDFLDFVGEILDGIYAEGIDIKGSDYELRIYSELKLYERMKRTYPEFFDSE